MTAARRASTGAAHGARSHHNRTPACPPPPDYRIAARRDPGCLTASAPPAGLRPVLDPPGPLTRTGSSRGTRQTTAPGRTPGPRASSACLQPREHGQKTCKIPVCPRFGADRAGVLAEGMPKSRAGKDGFARRGPGCPLTGSSRSSSASGLGPAAGSGRACPTAFNRAGEKLQATGGELLRVSNGVDPRWPCGLALPPHHRGGRSRAPAAARANGSAGQAASGWRLASPEATAASQLVPWTTME